MTPLPEATGGVSPEMRQAVEAVMKSAIAVGVLDEMGSADELRAAETAANEARASLLSAIRSLETDKQRLDWLNRQANCVVTINGLDEYILGTDETIREGIDRFRRAARTEEASR